MTKEELKELNEEIEGDFAEETPQETADAPATDEKPEKKAKADKPKKEDKKTRELKKRIEELEGELSELTDARLRLAAEYDNFRRRAQKEKEAAYSDAYADAIKEILPVIDNLERAAMFKDNDQVSEGVVMTLNQFKATLEKLGVTEMDTAPGTKFDPNFHNAIMHTDDDNFGEGEIAEVFQKGYLRGDKVIRYAMVKVAN